VADGSLAHTPTHTHTHTGAAHTTHAHNPPVSTKYFRSHGEGSEERACAARIQLRSSSTDVASPLQGHNTHTRAHTREKEYARPDRRSAGRSVLQHYTHTHTGARALYITFTRLKRARVRTVFILLYYRVCVYTRAHAFRYIENNNKKGRRINRLRYIRVVAPPHPPDHLFARLRIFSPFVFLLSLCVCTAVVGVCVCVCVCTGW